MSNPRIQIVVPDVFRAWGDGFGSAPNDVPEEAAEQWRIATDLFFDQTQQRVHIISAALKSSGRSSVELDGKVLVGEVAYGNEEVPYAQIEEDRGGEHAYLSIGWEAASRVYEDALDEAWSEVIGGWK